MSKVTKQASGVVGGAMDVSRQTVASVAQVTDAGAVLSDRKWAGTRARKLAALRKSQARIRAKAPLAKR